LRTTVVQKCANAQNYVRFSSSAERAGVAPISRRLCKPGHLRHGHSARRGL
jgi:hypothetical protein